jgi:hypothetical protein
MWASRDDICVGVTAKELILNFGANPDIALTKSDDRVASLRPTTHAVAHFGLSEKTLQTWSLQLGCVEQVLGISPSRMRQVP